MRISTNRHHYSNGYRGIMHLHTHKSHHKDTKYARHTHKNSPFDKAASLKIHISALLLNHHY